MRVSAVVTREGSRYFAQAVEVDRMGEGATEAQAVASLREALEEYYSEVPAVAPPEREEIEPIEIVITERPAHVVLRP
jgi:hypothetical protein